ncbi:hypothetical protein [Tessaracoccus flavescens]|uniref:hypothetical protein n=1 Tax=Tessaracoccus flavescens TaxID=399497 RepID=UPI001260214E|nr:hypothetical protein [Tessaracoccus flavescens]
MLTAEPHRDHSHHFAGEPHLTEVTYQAPKAGHVVVHEGRTVLFGDGDGSNQVVDSAKIADPDAAARAFSADAPHHGVALKLDEGSF